MLAFNVRSQALCLNPVSFISLCVSLTKQYQMPNMPSLVHLLLNQISSDFDNNVFYVLLFKAVSIKITLNGNIKV